MSIRRFILSILALTATLVGLTSARVVELRIRDDPATTICFTSPGASASIISTTYTTTEFTSTTQITTTTPTTTIVAPTTLTISTSTLLTQELYAYVTATPTSTSIVYIYTTTVTITSTDTQTVTSGATIVTVSIPTGWLNVDDTLPGVQYKKRQEQETSTEVTESPITTPTLSSRRTITRLALSTTLSTASSTISSPTTETSITTSSTTPTTTVSTSPTSSTSSRAPSYVSCNVITTYTTTETIAEDNIVTSLASVETTTEIRPVKTVVTRTVTQIQLTVTTTTITTEYIRTTYTRTFVVVPVPSQTVYPQCDYYNQGNSVDNQEIAGWRLPLDVTTTQTNAPDFFSCCTLAVSNPYGAGFAFIPGDYCFIFERATCSGVDQSSGLTAVLAPYGEFRYSIGNANCGKWNSLATS